jgi:hypothetical protein
MFLMHAFSMPARQSPDDKWDLSMIYRRQCCGEQALELGVHISLNKVLIYNLSTSPVQTDAKRRLV